MAVRMGEWRETNRRAMADRTPESRSCLDSGCVAHVRMKIDTEGAASGRREIGRQPERQFGCIPSADEHVGSARRRDADNALTPTLEQEAQIADRPCPWDRTNDRQDGRINLRTPGDRWRVDRDCVGIWRERSVPNGTTSLPADAVRQ